MLITITIDLPDWVAPTDLNQKTYPDMPAPGSSVTTAPGYTLKTVKRNGTVYKQWYPTGPRKVSEATRRAELSRESRP